ncbi:MAG: SDR family NAD(P)-dependent oxidoreductase [Pedobacter sp.]|uniref:SDR family NAD(P)-dependent oxidoreductase n=1 Tax=Pedobacter sp. TaxID=1411316 RepID=UPI003399F13A
MSYTNSISQQGPVGSGFNAASTTEDVINGIDLSGKTAIITGGYAGIGLQTTKTFIEAGATVIVPARDLRKAAASLSGLENVEIAYMDLMDPLSINEFAKQFLSSGRPLHLLINNAGIMWVPLRRDARGYESQLSTNHLGHFQLTAALWLALKQAQGARVINVSSWGHHFGPFNFEDPNFVSREYETLLGYGQSKTANILFSLELDKRAKQYDVRSFSLHPGAIVETDLKRYLSKEQLIKIGVYDSNGNVLHNPDMGMKTISQGASTTVWAATSPQLNGLGGLYCENTDVAQIDNTTNDFKELNSLDLPGGVTPYAIDPATAVRLWDVSEQLTGIKFEIK